MYQSGITRAVIIGTGRVGSHCAMSLIARRLIDEIVLIDANMAFAKAQATDLSDFAIGMGSSVTVRAGSYADCDAATFALVTAGRGRRPGESRLDLLNDTLGVLSNIADQLSATDFDGLVICVTNPVDIATEYLYHRLNLPSSQILGTGTSLDTIRLKRILSERTGVDAKQIQGFCMGEHGDSSFIAWSHVSLGGVPLPEFLQSSQNGERLFEMEEIQDEVHVTGASIISGKHCTEFGVGSVVTDVIAAVSRNQMRVLPLSVHLSGQYGWHGLSIGTPCIVNGQGIERVLETNLTPKEQELMQASCELIERRLRSIDRLNTT